MAEEVNEESLENLTGTEKSAILMMLLGEDEAAQVLQKLTPREVQHLGTAMYSVTGVDQTTVNAVLDEFLETIKNRLVLVWVLVNTLRMFLQRPWVMIKLNRYWVGLLLPAQSRKLISLIGWMRVQFQNLS